MKKIIVIIGARPQFIKHFAFESEAKGRVNLVTIHTGQHYDENMSQVFFNELGLSKPSYILQLGGGNHGTQTGKMMIEIEDIVLKENPDFVVVYGDTNSTLAGALVASKLHIPLVHIEAGLRSFNKEMPEEINRVLTDHISDFLFVPSQISADNLFNEGIKKNVFIVGDIMKDLVLKAYNEGWIKQPNFKDPFYYATLHRPYNTDDKERLKYVLNSLNSLDKSVIFSIHPRTRIAMKNYTMVESDFNNITFIDPQSYLSNLSYLMYSGGLITDSGGMQKEAYWLRKSCVTVRKETEWLETITGGCNTILFNDLSSMNECFTKPKPMYDSALYGDGNTSQRIIETLIN